MISTFIVVSEGRNSWSKISRPVGVMVDLHCDHEWVQDHIGDMLLKVSLREEDPLRMWVALPYGPGS